LTKPAAGLLALALAVLPLGAAIPARADVAACEAAIQKASAAFGKAELRALARCEDGIRKGKITPQDCRLEPKTAAALATADTKRAAAIGKACGGADKACGGDLAGEFGSDALLWPATCPGLTGAECDGATETAECTGIDACLACVVRGAVDETLAIAYGDLAPPSGEKALDKCRTAVAKAGPILHAARQKALGKCWKLVGKEKVEAPCPPHSTNHAPTTAALAAAEAKARDAICKACGGGDKACGGGDDLAPAAIGFPAQCPYVTPPPGAQSCANAILDLADLADCVVCTADFAADCADAATVPDELPYPPLCNQVCEPGEVRACYTGPAGTQDVGICEGGIETCDADGLGFGPCTGEVLPATEVCGNASDENCDGVLDDSPDLDGDGFTVCGGDCCDDLGCEDVNPGAFEVVGNTVDDDCNVVTDDASVPSCSFAASFDPSGTDLAQAMDICQLTTETDRTWGLLSATATRVSGAAIDPRQRAALAAFGNMVPQAGATFAGISGGTMRDADDPDFLAPDLGLNLGHSGAAPTAYIAAHEGVVPAEDGCPANASANDAVRLRLAIRAPTNARSFSYDFRYLTAEFPDGCTQFNDSYLALLASGAAGLPADANVSAQSNGIPFNPSSPLVAPCGLDCTGTGYSALIDGATVWQRTTSPVVPGETLTLDLLVFDQSDGDVDTSVLLDRFRWSTATAAGPTTAPAP
jgi:hypothetical protein